MKNRKSINIILATLAFAFVVTIMPGSINAQGRYANVYSRSQVKAYVDRLETSSNTFRRDFDRFMDRSNLNGTSTEDQFNRYVKDYESSLDRLRSQFNRRNNWWENRSNVQEMLNNAQPVNTMMTTLPFARDLERQWNAMRSDINKVADTFDLPGLNGGGWIGGNIGQWTGTGNMSSPPSWAQGSFNWVGTDQRQMVVDRNGRVSIYALGNTTYGTYNRGTIFINNDNLRVSRINNGIRLFNPNGGGTSDWTRY